MFIIVNRRSQINNGLLLGQRRGRLPHIEPALVKSGIHFIWLVYFYIMHNYFSVIFSTKSIMLDYTEYQQ